MDIKCILAQGLLCNYVLNKLAINFIYSMIIAMLIIGKEKDRKSKQRGRYWKKINQHVKMGL